MKVLVLAAVLGASLCVGTANAALAEAAPPQCNPSDITCVPYTCNYDVLCDAAGNVMPGPPLGSGGIRLGNGQICEANGCTRP